MSQSLQISSRNVLNVKHCSLKIHFLIPIHFLEVILKPEHCSVWSRDAVTWLLGIHGLASPSFNRINKLGLPLLDALIPDLSFRIFFRRAPTCQRIRNCRCKRNFVVKLFSEEGMKKCDTSSPNGLQLLELRQPNELTQDPRQHLPQLRVNELTEFIGLN